MISPVTVFTIKCCKVLLFVSSSILLDNILGDIFRQIGETRMLTNLILTKKCSQIFVFLQSCAKGIHVLELI